MNTLPEACIAKILYFTTPLDVCQSSVVSKIFSSAADSDDVWNHFLPTDFPEGFLAPAAFQTRKQFFFSLVHHPLLLHDSHLSFWLERRSGNKCYMLSARSLNIAWGKNQKYWEWTSIPDTRYGEVAELKWVCWFDIIGKINITLLSDETLYVAYLVFKWNPCSSGFREPVEASVFLVDTHTVNAQPSMVSLMQYRGNDAERRRDGWFEVKLGQFFKRRGDLGELVMNLKETTKLSLKRGLIVLGIEVQDSIISSKMNLRETKRLYEKRGLIVLGIEKRPMP